MESILNYKLDKLTGSSGIFAGYVLLVVGLITVYFTLTAIPLILLGGIMAFSFQSSQIDLVKRCYRYNLNLFGLWPMGRWKDFNKGDKILVQNFKGKSTTYSASNRQLDITNSDFRVILQLEGDVKKVALAKFQAEPEALELAGKLREIIQTTTSNT
jgi:hypothetical protein